MENGIKTSWRAWVGRRKVGETTARRTWIWAHEHNSKEQPSNGSARALSVRRRAPTIHSIPFHDIPFHDSTLHFITLHYITLRYITLRYIVGELSEFEGALPRSVLAMLVAIAKPAARAALAKARACVRFAIAQKLPPGLRAGGGGTRVHPRARARGARGLALPKPPDPRRVLVVRKTRGSAARVRVLSKPPDPRAIFFKCELLPGGERRAWSARGRCENCARVVRPCCPCAPRGPPARARRARALAARAARRRARARLRGGAMRPVLPWVKAPTPHVTRHST